MTLAALCLVLLAVLAVGVRTKGLLGGLLIVQAVYWGIGYVLRPGILLWLEPAPRYGDFLADPRLAALGYRTAVPTLLGLVLLSVVTTAVVTCVPAVRGWRRAAPAPRAVQVFDDTVSFTIFAAGWMFRALELTDSSSGLVSALSELPTVALGLALLHSARPRSWRFYLLAGLSELLWSVESLSKGPILALFVLFFLRRLRESGLPGLRASLGLVVLVFGAFTLVQASKTAQGTLADTGSAYAGYPAITRPVVGVVQRFDGLQAVTDAYLAGPGSWMSPTSALSEAVTSLVPRQLLPGGKGELVGKAWRLEVRSRTLPSPKGSDVSLAQGPAAEGFVIGGYWWIVLESIGTGLVFLLVVRALQSRRIFVISAGLAMLSEPFLFERGLLGVFEGAGRALEVATAALVVAAVYAGRRTLRQTGPQRRPHHVLRA